jgi:hypothetical protein
MLFIVLGVAVLGGVAYKLHITSIATLKSAVATEVSNLEAYVAKVEPVVKADLTAVIAKIKSML